MVTSITFTCSILPPQAIEQLGGRPPFDSQAHDEPPQENPHSRLNPELLKLIFIAIQNATNPALDFSNPNFLAHDIELIIDAQNPDNPSSPDEVDELAKLIILHKALSFKIKNEAQSTPSNLHQLVAKKDEAQIVAKKDEAQSKTHASKAVASLEEIEIKVEHLIETYFAKQKIQNQEPALLRKMTKDALEREPQLSHEKGKSTPQQKDQQEEKVLKEKAILKELVKGEFEKNRAEFTKVKTAETTQDIKDMAKLLTSVKSPERTEVDIRRAEKALEHAIKSLTSNPPPNPIPQQIIANIMVPYAAIESVESANGKEKSKTQKKKKKAPKQKKRVFRKLLKKMLS